MNISTYIAPIYKINKCLFIHCIVSIGLKNKFAKAHYGANIMLQLKGKSHKNVLCKRSTYCNFKG